MVDDSDKIAAMMQNKTNNEDFAQQVSLVQALRSKKTSMQTVLNNYIGTIDAAIADTDSATNAVIAARAAVDADNTVNANLKAELRALENAVLKLRTENRNYRTAFVYIRDTYCNIDD